MIAAPVSRLASALEDASARNPGMFILLTSFFVELAVVVRRQLFQKLDVHTRAQLVKIALEQYKDQL